MLVGPKGAGKSHIGHLLEKNLGITFIVVDQIWIQLKKERPDYGSIACREEAARRMYTRVQEALVKHSNVCLESTGVGPQKQAFIESLSNLGRVLLIKVGASERTCIERIKCRNNSGHVPMDEEAIMKVNREASALMMEWTLIFNNEPYLAEVEIVNQVKKLLPL